MSDQDYEQRERQRELEEKKRKLAEMKAAKLRQKNERILGKRIENVSTRPTMTPAELDAMMADLGIQPRTNREEAPSDPSSTHSTARECNGGLLHWNDKDGNRSKSPRRPQKLELVSTQPVTIQPKNEFITYSKASQTDEERERHGEFSMGSQEFAFDELSIDEEMAAAGQIDAGTVEDSPTMEVRKHLKNLHFHHCSHSTQKDATLSEDRFHQSSQAHKVPPLSDEEKRKILGSAAFTRYFQQASRVIERAIAEDTDVFIDYITDGTRTDPADDKRELLTLNRKIVAPVMGGQQHHHQQQALKQQQQQLTSTNATACGAGVRPVCAVEFSAIFPELVAVCHDRDKDAPLAPDSVIFVWNTRFKTASPEMTFVSSSRVMSLTFDMFNPNIIFGACYSGQICIWDTRVNKRMPVCKTPLTAKAHTQPLLCMQMVGTANAHDLVTVSTDGRMCSWSIDNLQSPIEVNELTCNRTKKMICALSMAFVHNSINNYVLGTEEGELYIGDRHAASADASRSIAAHSLPITSLDTHRAMGSIDFSSLCLTCSLDFSIKLWNIKGQQPPPPQGQLLSTPLLTFDRKHKFYVTDVHWSPVHPAVFASLSAEGMLNLWNINMNTEKPITSVALGEPGTKFRWSHNGQQIVAGDESGAVHIFDVHESLCNARPSEWDTLKNVLTDLAV